MGKRMKSKNGVLKQFLEIDKIPILIRTIKTFEIEEEIDAIVVVMKYGFIDYTNELLDKYKIKKVKRVVVGGETGQESIYNGLIAAQEISKSDDDIVLIHDGVRPFIDGELIRANIESVKKYGSAISCVALTETVLVSDGNQHISQIPLRANTLVAKAPQSFYLKDIIAAHKKTMEAGIYDSVDSCTLMYKYEKDLAIIMTDYDNIKITTPEDLFVAESIHKKKNKKRKS